MKNRFVMPKKTNFEQIPLDMVKKIVEEQVEREETESGREIKRKELKQLEQFLPAGSGPNGRGRKT